MVLANSQANFLFADLDYRERGRERERTEDESGVRSNVFST